MNSIGRYTPALKQLLKDAQRSFSIIGSTKAVKTFECRTYNCEDMGLNQLECSKGRNNRVPKRVKYLNIESKIMKANHGARPCSSVMRRLRNKVIWVRGKNFFKS